MSGRFLGQRIKIKFCEKLRKNASDTCTLLSEADGGETAKSKGNGNGNGKGKGRGKGNGKGNGKR
jgi:hypothetical protein